MKRSRVLSEECVKNESEEEVESKKVEKVEKKVKKEEIESKSKPDGFSKDGNPYFNLDAKKRLSISKFKNQVLVDIREFYDSGDGTMLPTKKGVSLNLTCYEELKKKFKEIDEEISKLLK